MKKYKLYFEFAFKNIIFIIITIAFNGLSGLSKSLSSVYLQKITDGLDQNIFTSILYYVIIGGGLAIFCYIFKWIGAVIPNYFMI